MKPNIIYYLLSSLLFLSACMGENQALLIPETHPANAEALEAKIYPASKTLDRSGTAEAKNQNATKVPHDHKKMEKKTMEGMDHHAK